MPEVAQPTTRVLFVDDDSSFLEMVLRVFGELSQGAWEIHLADHAQAALTLLQRQPVDLAVLDVYMPNVDGLQLLSALNRDYPNLPKVFLTGGADTQTRVAGLEGGAQLFLEKPSNAAGIQNVFATLNELVKWHQKQGLRGGPRRAGLLDMVKLECVSGNSRLFEVSAPGGHGLIFIKDGDIIHAEAEGRRGQSAFTYLASLADVEFNLKLFVEPSERSIYRQWEFLFLEAIQLQEQMSQTEMRAREGPSPAAPAPEPAPARHPPAPSATSAVSAVSAVARQAAPARPPSPPSPASVPSDPSSIATETQVSRKAPLPQLGPLRMMTSAPGTRPAKTAPRDIELPPAKPAPARLDLAFDDSEASLQIEEMLVCSSKSEVLHDWQCPQTEERLKFADRLRQQCEHLGGALPLGRCDRVEAQAAEGRMVVQFQTDATVLLRSNTRGQRTTNVTSPVNALSAEWLARHARARGLLAAGVFQAQTKVVQLTSAVELSAHNLNPTWRAAAGLFELFEQQQLRAWFVRCIYDQAQLYCARREDGLSLGIIVAKGPQVLDTDAAGRMFEEFAVLSPA
jgi:CheY-like chemotaxis protein